MRVLLIEDSEATQQSIEVMLKSENFEVRTAYLRQEGHDLGNLYGYDIILLHLNTPDSLDLEVLRKIRAAKGTTPMLVVSGHVDNQDKVNGLNLGIGDYMIRPIHKVELVARMHAIARRSKGLIASVVNVGDLTVNLERKTVEVGGSRVGLTTKEYEVLETLTLRKGTTLTKEMLLNRLYGGLDEPNAKIIDVFICKLRKKLAIASDGKNYIETVWGRGYMLREPSDDEPQMQAYRAVQMTAM